MCVFAPVGLAVTLVEELPAFIDKGRQRVELQLGNAASWGASWSTMDSER